MSEFEVYTAATAPKNAVASLDGAKAKFGFTPNLLGVMAGAPPLLEAYLTMMGIASRTNLTGVEQQVVYQAVNFEAGCTYCVAAHSVASDGAGIPADITDALRAGGTLPDAKLNTLAEFVRKMHSAGGWVSEADRAELYAAGYSSETVLEVIVLMATKTLTNFTNHAAGTPLDAAFEGRRWEKPLVEAAE
ncbi:MAG: carboxymuconolactone decarboxylase family protein [Kordiimonadaceae bacterium]|nr:carboxymuconolactone decarboxylase family protein [Kordiimonadaceae bacterium]